MSHTKNTDETNEQLVMTYLHVLQSLVHDLLWILQVLEYIIEVGFRNARKPVKQIHIEGRAAAAGNDAGHR